MFVVHLRTRSSPTFSHDAEDEDEQVDDVQIPKLRNIGGFKMLLAVPLWISNMSGICNSFDSREKSCHDFSFDRSIFAKYIMAPN